MLVEVPPQLLAVGINNDGEERDAQLYPADDAEGGAGRGLGLPLGQEVAAAEPEEVAQQHQGHRDLAAPVAVAVQPD